jgi:HPr kinase/phosphorylase
MRRERSVSIEQLIAETGPELKLKVFSDWGGLDHDVARPRTQRPGLALTGFVRHVYADRIQVLGLTEIDYLMSQPAETLREPLETYFAKKPCALVVTRGLEPPNVLIEPSREHGVPILVTTLMHATFVSRIQRYLEDKLAPRATVHGVLVDILGVGLLVIGRSGVGKSEAALDLVLKGHRLVADDVVEVAVRPPDIVYGVATELHQHMMEIRGMGILNITKLFGVGAVRDRKRIEVVVELGDMADHEYDRLGTEQNVWPILGVDLPLVRIPLQPGRNTASLIEVVARNELLKYRGHDSAREFQAKIDAHIKSLSSEAAEKAEKKAPTTQSRLAGDVE